MKRSRRSAALMAVVLSVTFGGFAACEKKGPAEKAGEKIDKAVDKVKDTFDPKGPAEKAGEKIDRALDNDD